MRSLGHAFPCEGRGFFLKRRIDGRLLESLGAIVQVAENDNWIEKSQTTTNKIQTLSPARGNLSPFIYTLYNALVTAFEEENFDAATDLLKIFHQQSFDHPNTIISYQDPFIAPWLWNKFDHVSIHALPETTQLWPCSKDMLDTGTQIIHRSLSLLSIAAPDVYTEHKAIVNKFILLDSNRFIAGSSFDLLGAIILKINASTTLLDIVDLIIHETGHQYLFMLSTLDPLCTNNPEEMYTSPLRKDPRPMLGIYHAMFVIARLIYGFSKIKLKSDDFHLDEQEIDDRLKNYKELYASSLPTVYNQGHLTPLGLKLMRSSQSMLK